MGVVKGIASMWCGCTETGPLFQQGTRDFVVGVGDLVDLPGGTW